MKKLLAGFLAAFVLLSAGASAHAATPIPPTAVSVEGLSAEEVKAVQAKVEEVKQAQRKANPELTMMDQAVELGRIIGSGLVATAKELGVAANDFAKSDLGRVVMYILIWKYLGQDIIGVLVGIPLIIAGVTIGLRLVRTASWGTTVKEYAATNVLWGLFTIKRLIRHEQTKREDLKDADNWQIAIGYIIIFVSVIIGLVTIF